VTGAAAARAVSGHAVVANLATHVPGTGPRAFLPGAWKEMDRVRREGSAIVANAAIAAGVERLIQESFALTYPDSGARWVDESAPPRPAPYNRTVLDAEASAGRVTEAGRIGVALRFALLYGGVEDGFTRDILQYARRGWLPLLGRPDGYVSMVTHDDAARAVVAALDAPPGIYNVVDDEPLTRYELTRILGDVLSVPLRSCRRRGSRRSAARSARRSRSRCASRIARCAPPRAGAPLPERT
jgi:nucleoside-diphosphate-sugar epimerase